MKRTAPAGRRRRPVALLAALALPISAMSALALSGGAAAEEPTSPSLTASYDAEAFAKAASTGKRVEILDRREETAEVFANPDGSLTRRQYSAPVWSRITGKWQATDATLALRGDGTVAPLSPAFGIAFSGGGSTPLATMDKGGRKLSLAWPTPLPAPVLSGSTATYPSVLPDVDLKVIADVDGFSEQLIVKTAAAAANPAVKSIKLGISAEGVSLDDDATDNLIAKDADGKVVFSAPRPKMWQAPANAAPATKSSGAKSAATAEASAADPTASAPVTADVTGGTLTLTPDATALASASQFPVVIDPAFTGGYREKWAVVYSAYPGEDYPNGSGWHSDNPADEPRVGYNGSGATRSFFAMNTNGLEGADISDAKFAVTETHSWGCDPSAAGPTELWSSGSIDTTPTWNTSGSLLAAKLDAASFAHGNPTYCPGDQGHDFHSAALTSYVQKAADNSWGTLVFALKAASGYEYNQNSFKRFKNSPALEVTYNYKPTVSDVAAYEGTWNPSGDGNKQVPCGGTMGNSGLALTAKLHDKDGGKITADFHVTNTTTGAAVNFDNHTDTVSDNHTASVTVPSKPLVSGTYSWLVTARDTEGTDAAVYMNCTFTVDAEGPENVSVTTPDGQDPDTASAIADARTPRQLKLTDPAADLDGFCYLMDRPLSVSGTRCSNGTYVTAAADHTANITVTPTGSPFSTLHVIAYDKAGNHSPYDGAAGSVGDTVQLSTHKTPFVYAPDKTPDSLAIADLPGDLNGDGYADFVAIDTDAKLRFYAGDGTGKVAASKIVGSGGWTGALIAHHGDYANFTSPTAAPDGYEDFFVRLPDNNLYLYPGDGLGAPDYYSRTMLDEPAESTWKRTRQIIMPGNVDGNPGDDLITVQCIDDACTNAQLWLFSGNGIGGGGADQTHPFDTSKHTLLGTGGWRDLTNLAVGNQNDDPAGVADIIARDPATGQLFLYPGRLDTATHIYSLGARTPYGGPGWDTTNRPLLTSPGNVQGTVATDSTDVEGTQVTYRHFVPKTGDGSGDFWATTAASSTATVTYADNNGTSQSTTCPTGCLLFYPGGPTWHRTPNLVGTAAWSSQITAIY